MPLKPIDYRPIYDVLTPEGGLERRVSTSSWFVPGQIWLERERLWWSNTETGRNVRPSAGMFEDFIALAEAADHKVVPYAKRWGVLGICKHGLPSCHEPSHLEVGRLGCRPLGWEDGRCWEPINHWRYFAAQAFSLLRISNRLGQGKLADPADWERVYARSPRGVPPMNKNLTVQEYLLVEWLNFWLAVGDVRPKVEWRKTGDRPAVKFRSGLFGALAVQLVLGVAKLEGWAICTHCRKEYIPQKRLPKAGQRNFCPECRNAKVPRQYAMRDFALRKRESQG